MLKAEEDNFASVALWNAVLMHQRITDSHLTIETN